MLEYNLDDAQVLLEKNLISAKKTLTQVDDDLSFLRDQTTTLEVSILAIFGCHKNLGYLDCDLLQFSYLFFKAYLVLLCTV